MVNQTRKLCEGAMMVALVGVMLFVNRQLANMMEYVMYWVLTFPILIYTAKYGIKYGILTSVCMLLLSLMIATVTTIFYLFCCVLVGLVYGEGVRRNWKNGTLLCMSGIVTLISYIMTTIVFATLFGYSPQDDVEMVTMLIQLMRMEVAVAKVVPYIVLMMAVGMSVLQTICIHMVAKLILRRLRIPIREMKSLFEIHVSPRCGIIIIIIWVLFLLRNVLKLNQDISIILLIIYLCAFVFALGYGALTCMVACIWYRKRGLVFVVLVGLFLPYVQQVIACVGIADMLWLIRKKMKRGIVHG